MLKYMSRVRWQDKITNEEVRRRCGVKNLECPKIMENEVEMVWSCKT